MVSALVVGKLGHGGPDGVAQYGNIMTASNILPAAESYDCRILGLMTCIQPALSRGHI